jgi:hypothetical protein
MKQYFFIFTFLLFTFLTSVSFGFDVRVPLAARQVSLDPTTLYDQSSLWISRHIHCQLARKIQGKITLEAAASMEYVNPKRLKIVLNLDYMFQNGARIQAQDVIASFNFLKKSRISYKAQFSLVETVSSSDSKTLFFDFKDDTAKLFMDFFSTSQNPILPKEFLERAEKNKALLESPLGCGNYHISEYIPGDHISLISAQSSLPRLIFTLLEKNQLTSLEFQKFDLINLPIDRNEPGKPKASEFNELHLFDPYQIVLGMNSTLNPWTQRENRCSLFARLDTNIPLQLYGSTANLAHDIYPSGVVGFSPSSDFKTYYNKNSIQRPNLGTRPFCISFVAPSIPISLRAGYVKMIEKVFPNIQVKQITDPKEFGPTFLNQKCDAIVIGFKSNNLDGADFLNVFTERTVNYTGYSSASLKSEILNSLKLEDIGYRAEKFKFISQEIKKKCLIMPIMTVPYKTFYTRKTLEFPEIGKSVLNEYYLGNVREK